MNGRVYAIAGAGIFLVMLATVAAEASNADTQALQGKWLVTSFEYNGAQVDRMKNAIREFKDGKYSLTPKSGDVIEGTVSLDESKTPKTIDLDVNGRILRGIYQLEGDTLKLCYNLSSEERPTEFVSKPDTGLIVVVHSREK
jgi:uncharacterized protein (TIGR03067 family)